MHFLPLLNGRCGGERRDGGGWRCTFYTAKRRCSAIATCSFWLAFAALTPAVAYTLRLPNCRNCLRAITALPGVADYSRGVRRPCLPWRVLLFRMVYWVLTGVCQYLSLRCSVPPGGAWLLLPHGCAGFQRSVLACAAFAPSSSRLHLISPPCPCLGNALSLLRACLACISPIERYTMFRRLLRAYTVPRWRV